MISPAMSLFCVLALNCLQNSMMLIPAWPSAGPTGGAGVALPASICSFTYPVTFLGAIAQFLQGLSPQNQISLRDDLLYLAELELHRRRAAEDRDHHRDFALVFVHIVDHTLEGGERALGDADLLVLLELHAQLRLVLAGVDAIDDLIDLILAKCRGMLRRPQ